MRVFRKVLLRWKEPKVLRRAGYREGKRSIARMLPAIVLASLVIIGVTYTFAGEAALRAGAATGLLILFLYMVLWIYRVFPSCVEISERGIHQSVTDDETTWKFKAIGHCEIAKAMVEGKEVRLLVIETTKGNRSDIGIADEVPTETLQAILRSKGVKVITIAEPLRSENG